jgi:hypothetical protein
MTGTLWRGEAGLEGEQLGLPGKGLEGSQGISYGQASLPMNSQRGTRPLMSRRASRSSW